MSAMSTILLGAIAFTNVALVAYLLGDRNRTIKSPPENKESPKPQPPEVVETLADKGTPKVSENPKQTTRVGASKFDVDEFMQKFERLEQGFFKMNQTLERIEGEVRLNDVEFANDEDKPSEEEIAKDNVKSTNSNEIANGNNEEIRIPNDKLDETFQDARIEEFDGDTISSPEASGSTIEDIEESINAATDPNAYTEEKIKAAQTLCPLLDTNLMVAAEEKIKQDILACVKEYIRVEVSEKSKPKSQPKQKPKSKPAPKPKKDFLISKKLDDFNPDDLIPD